jgi:PAS domain S-box-containing protein
MKMYCTQTVQEAIAAFYETGKDMMTIVDQDEKVVGYLTLEDLARAIQLGELTEPVEYVMRKEVAHLTTLLDERKMKSEYDEFLSSSFFSNIINSLHDGVYITDGKGVTAFVNRAYERIARIKKEEVIGYHMKDLVKKGFISQSASIEVLKEKRPITMMQTIRDKRKIIVSATPIFDENHQIIYVISSVRDITELLKLKHELDGLQFWSKQRTIESVAEQEKLTDLVTSEKTNLLYKLAEKVAKTDVKVLLQGETGVGKSILAKFIHDQSRRKSQVFMELNCAAIPANLIEAELFGYEPGAFTGALKNGKKGILEKANGGTLFLDEIGDLPLELQVKLLKVVEENKFMRVGSTEVQAVNVRIISATHKNLKELVEKGQFREDLYYRLNIVPLYVPPLRERKEEIIPLLNHFLAKYNQQHGQTKKWDIECLELLTNYSWPGNIRELSNLVERLVVTTFEDEITVGDLPEELRYPKEEILPDSGIIPLKKAVELVEKKLIIRAMEQYETTRKAAEALQVSQATIVQKMKKFHIRLNE